MGPPIKRRSTTNVVVGVGNNNTTTVKNATTTTTTAAQTRKSSRNNNNAVKGIRTDGKRGSPIAFASAVAAAAAVPRDNTISKKKTQQQQQQQMMTKKTTTKKQLSLPIEKQSLIVEIKDNENTDNHSHHPPNDDDDDDEGADDVDVDDSNENDHDDDDDDDDVPLIRHRQVIQKKQQQKKEKTKTVVAATTTTAIAATAAAEAAKQKYRRRNSNSDGTTTNTTTTTTTITTTNTDEVSLSPTATTMGTTKSNKLTTAITTTTTVVVVPPPPPPPPPVATTIGDTMSNEMMNDRSSSSSPVSKQKLPDNRMASSDCGSSIISSITTNMLTTTTTKSAGITIAAADSYNRSEKILSVDGATTTNNDHCYPPTAATITTTTTNDDDVSMAMHTTNDTDVGGVCDMDIDENNSNTDIDRDNGDYDPGKIPVEQVSAAAAVQPSTESTPTTTVPNERDSTTAMTTTTTIDASKPSLMTFDMDVDNGSDKSVEAVAVSSTNDLTTGIITNIGSRKNDYNPLMLLLDGISLSTTLPALSAPTTTQPQESSPQSRQRRLTRRSSTPIAATKPLTNTTFNVKQQQQSKKQSNANNPNDDHFEEETTTNDSNVPVVENVVIVERYKTDNDTNRKTATTSRSTRLRSKTPPPENTSLSFTLRSHEDHVKSIPTRLRSKTPPPEKTSSSLSFTLRSHEDHDKPIPTRLRSKTPPPEKTSSSLSFTLRSHEVQDKPIPTRLRSKTPPPEKTSLSITLRNHEELDKSIPTRLRSKTPPPENSSSSFTRTRLRSKTPPLEKLSMTVGKPEPRRPSPASAAVIEVIKAAATPSDIPTTTAGSLSVDETPKIEYTDDNLVMVLASAEAGTANDDTTQASMLTENVKHDDINNIESAAVAENITPDIEELVIEQVPTVVTQPAKEPIDATTPSIEIVFTVPHYKTMTMETTDVDCADTAVNDNLLGGCINYQQMLLVVDKNSNDNDRTTLSMVMEGTGTQHHNEKDALIGETMKPTTSIPITEHTKTTSGAESAKHIPAAAIPVMKSIGADVAITTTGSKTIGAILITDIKIRSDIDSRKTFDSDASTNKMHFIAAPVANNYTRRNDNMDGTETDIETSDAKATSRAPPPNDDIENQDTAAVVVDDLVCREDESAFDYPVASNLSLKDRLIEEPPLLTSMVTTPATTLTIVMATLDPPTTGPTTTDKHEDVFMDQITPPKIVVDVTTSKCGGELSVDKGDAPVTDIENGNSKNNIIQMDNHESLQSASAIATIRSTTNVLDVTAVGKTTLVLEDSSSCISKYIGTTELENITVGSVLNIGDVSPSEEEPSNNGVVLLLDDTKDVIQSAVSAAEQNTHHPSDTTESLSHNPALGVICVDHSGKLHMESTKIVSAFPDLIPQSTSLTIDVHEPMDLNQEDEIKAVEKTVSKSQVESLSSDQPSDAGAPETPTDRNHIMELNIEEVLLDTRPITNDNKQIGDVDMSSNMDSCLELSNSALQFKMIVTDEHSAVKAVATEQAVVVALTPLPDSNPPTTSKQSSRVSHHLEYDSDRLNNLPTRADIEKASLKRAFSDGQSSRKRLRALPIASEHASTMKMKQPNICKIKLLLYTAGKLLHSKHTMDYDVVFCDYWNALSRRLEGPLNASEMKTNQRSLNSFLKAKSLRKLHNQLILGLMECCINTQAPVSVISHDIPRHLRDRINIVTVDSEKAKRRALEQITSIDETEVLQLTKKHRVSEPAYTPVVLEPTSSVESSALKNSYIASMRIPGVLIVDPQVRKLAESHGLKVSEHAVWLLAIAVKEFCKSLLSKSLSTTNAVTLGRVPQHLSRLFDVVYSVRGTESTSKSILDESNTSKNVIKSSDLHAVIANLPISSRSLSGSVSRTLFERSLGSAVNSSLVLGGNVFDEIKQHIISKVTPIGSKGSRADSSAAPPPTHFMHHFTSHSNQFTSPGRAAAHAQGLGRGAKDLASLKARASNVTTQEAGDWIPKSSQGEHTTTIQASPLAHRNAGKKSQLGEVSESPLLDSDILERVSGSSETSETRRGKGHGVKNLAAMKARSATSSSDLVEDMAKAAAADVMDTCKNETSSRPSDPSETVTTACDSKSNVESSVLDAVVAGSDAALVSALAITNNATEPSQETPTTGSGNRTTVDMRNLEKPFSNGTVSTPNVTIVDASNVVESLPTVVTTSTTYATTCGASHVTESLPTVPANVASPPTTPDQTNPNFPQQSTVLALDGVESTTGTVSNTIDEVATVTVATSTSTDIVMIDKTEDSKTSGMNETVVEAEHGNMEQNESLLL